MTETIREAMKNNHPIFLWKQKNPKGTIELKKDKQFIKCIKNNGKVVEYWYDLSEKKFMAHYSTKKEDRYVNVKSITSWFSGYNIITYNYKFAKTIIFNKNHSSFKNFKNPARFINGLGYSSCINYEQWESIGIKIKEVEDELDNPNIGRPISQYRYKYHSQIWKQPSEVDKKIIKILQQFENPITIPELNDFISDDYNWDKHMILLELMKYEKEPEYEDLFLVRESRYGYSELESVISTSKYTYSRNKLLNIIYKFNIDIERFVKYLRQLKDFEHTDIRWVINNYDDYLEAELYLRNNRKRKMNKYPSNLVQMHHNRTSVLADIKAEKERLKNLEQREKDKKIYESYKNLEWKPYTQDYCIIVPSCADDVIEEGNKMNHCVGSYIGRISDEKTFIVFMREKENKDIPYITVEIQNGQLCTALGYMNRVLDKDEKKFLEKYAEKKNLKYTAYTKIGDDN